MVGVKVAHTEVNIIGVWFSIFTIDNRRDVVDPFTLVCIIVGGFIK